MNQLVPIASYAPAIVRAAGERAQTRFWEFFVSNIHNPHTRRAYGRSIAEFLAWCEQPPCRLTSIVDVEPLHVGAYIEAVTRTHSAPTAKQKLAAIRVLFDWLVTVDHPFRSPERDEEGGERVGISERCVRAEELESAGLCSVR